MEPLFLKSIKGAIKHWYIPLLVGLLFIVVSIIAFTSPLNSLLALSLLFALSFLFGGIVETIFSIANRNHLPNWGWSLIFGLLTLVVGFLLLIDPKLSVAALSFYIGFLILFRSLAAISFAFDLKRYGVKDWGFSMAFGIIGAIFSFILLWNPLLAGIGAVVLIGFSLFFGGLFSIFFSFQLRKIHKRLKKMPAELEERYRKLKEEIIVEWEDF